MVMHSSGSRSQIVQLCCSTQHCDARSANGTKHRETVNMCMLHTLCNKPLVMLICCRHVVASMHIVHLPLGAKSLRTISAFLKITRCAFY